VLFIPSCPGYTGLTGALDRSNRCESLVGFASGELLDSCVFGSWCCWSVLDLFGVVLLGFGENWLHTIKRSHVWQSTIKRLLVCYLASKDHTLLISSTSVTLANVPLYLRSRVVFFAA
jgi:hypothetical protein